MKYSCLVICCALILMPTALAGSGDADKKPSQAVLKAFERFKALEGSWSGTNSHGEQVRVDYRLTGNGTAVLESYRAEGGEDPHDMTTLYHLDGSRLVLTHYCVMGNQPRMASAAGLVGNKVEFDFVDLGNADPSRDGHMHFAAFEFESDNRYQTSWTFFENGQERFTEKMVMERK